MWTSATRDKYSRPELRYQSDVTEEELRVIEPFLSTSSPRRPATAR